MVPSIVTKKTSESNPKTNMRNLNMVCNEGDERSILEIYTIKVTVKREVKVIIQILTTNEGNGGKLFSPG